jgi:outer membrane lipoprotein SlyB
MSTANILSIEPVDLDELLESASAGAEAGAEIGGGLGAAIGAALGGIAAGAAVDVSFSCHGGGERTYRYYGAEALEILAGSDPSGFTGERIS